MEQPEARRPCRESRRARCPACGLALTMSLLFTGAVDTVSAQPGSDEESAVLAVVTRLFDGMRARDAQTLRSVFAESARLGDQGVEGFIAQVAGGDAYLDEVTFDETVLVDGDLAMAWTPYNLFVDDLFHHCGVDVFIMHRIDGEWLITQLDDTRRSEGCDPQRRN